jgi:pyruvate dehydrogenase E1 component alpha subunit
LRYFEEMLVVRLFEERVLELRRSEEVQGSVHLCIGQEAVPVGACAALNVDDPVYATYRGHGWALACGAPLEAMFAEVLGRESGVNAGRGGSAYLSCSSAAFMGENSIVGGGVPIAVGSALASRFRKDGKVAVTVFGDGATNQGSVHEAMNMAAAFSLAVIFVCENNVYSELTPIADMVAEADLSKRAAAYGMRSLRVDGNDPDAVAAAVGEAAEEARAGAGPTFVEALTYRLCGHYIGDAETYRTPEEVDEARIREPLVAIIDALGAAGVEPSSIDECRDNAHRRVEVAADTALTTPFAPTNTVREHLYA